ncbi:TPA: hypothetical protein IAB95_07265 [Candidatus Ventrenecus avicola]|nr:hypothetical protein [Candidatus Ventrenecus avicola]
MIITAVLELCEMLLTIIFGLLPDIPNFDSGVLNSLNGFINLIFDNLDLLGFFIDIELVGALIPWLIIVLNFEHIYDFTMWIIRKIPILNIS